MQMVYIIVLNWNGWADTLECLGSLQALNYQKRQLLVIDNGSTNDSVARIRQRFPDVEVMETGRNLGFAAGNNIGIRYALSRGAKYVWLINNDAKADPNALTSLVETADAFPKAGAVGSVIYQMDEPRQIQAWGGGGVSLWLGKTWVHTTQRASRRLDYLSGASLLLRREALVEVGLLDERYFMYWDDTDVCVRLRKAGWRLAVAERSYVWHKQCASLGRKSPEVDLYMKTSMAHFFHQHAPVPFVPILIGVGQIFAKRILQRDWRRVLALWRSIFQRSDGELKIENQPQDQNP